MEIEHIIKLEQKYGWAPGLWAGMDNCYIFINKVDHVNKHLEIKVIISDVWSEPIQFRKSLWKSIKHFVKSAIK